LDCLSCGKSQDVFNDNDDNSVNLLGDVVTNEDLLVVEEHAIDRLDGVLGSLRSLVVDEAVTLGVALLIDSDLAGENITKCDERIVERLWNRKNSKG
jgi:hypothetical protein